MSEARDHFHSGYYHPTRAIAPVPRLNATRRHLPLKHKVLPTEGESKIPSSLKESPGVVHVWRARDNRKGRHAAVVHPDFESHPATKVPSRTDTVRSTLKGVRKMLIRYPIWDVSYDTAVLFTIGSIIWVLNGFFVFLPVQNPSSAFSGESAWGGGITAIVGATVFEVGSIFLMIEAVNENRSECFGWALEETADGFLHLRPSLECRHHHRSKRNLVTSSSLEEHVEHPASKGPDWADRTFRWWPTWYELRTHYIRELGFLACAAQMFGATIFWISGFTALPPIQNNISHASLNGVYWVPQVVGGSGFCVSSLLFMVEVQTRWYIPAPGVLGWHIGFWNFVGAVGFTLCGALGFGGSQGAIAYALTLSTFIGSWAFLIGSVIQWYESLDKYPLWMGMEASVSDPT